MSDRPEMMPARMAFARIWVLLLALLDGCYGATYLLGAPVTAPYQLVLSEAVPTPVYSVAALLVAVLLVARRLRVAGIVGTAVWGAFAMASAITIRLGTAPSVVGPLIFGTIAAFHWLITYGASRGLSAHKMR
jgi:hypothetical protein